MPRDHLIPRFYLKNFSDDSGKVFVLSNELKRLINTKRAATSLNYYSDSNIPFDFEKLLNQHESAAAIILNKVLTNLGSNMTDQDCQKLFDFIKLSYIRSPRARKLVTEVGCVLQDHEFVEVFDHTSKSYMVKHRDSISPGASIIFDPKSIDTNDDHNDGIKGIHSNSFQRAMCRYPDLYKMFDFKIFVLENQSLVTSDSFVITFSGDNLSGGLASSSVIYSPLGSNVGLLCFAKEFPESDRNLYENVEYLNGLVMKSARKFVVSHPRNRNLIENFEINSELNELDVHGI